MKRIILIGAHGTGKSTLAIEYKKRYGAYINEGYGRIVNVWQNENLKGHEQFDSDTAFKVQQLISNLTLERFKADYEREKSQTYIATRSPLDCLCYSYLYGYCNSKKFKEYYNELIKLDYSDCIFVYIPIEFPLEEDGVRPSGEERQKLYDIQIKRILRDFNIDYESVSGSVENRVEQLRQIVESNGCKKCN